MRIDLDKVPVRLHSLGLVCGPLYAPIAHIQENGVSWPDLIGTEAKPLGAGRYEVGPMVVTLAPMRRPPSGPLDAGQYWHSDWQPLLPVLRSANAPTPEKGK